MRRLLQVPVAAYVLACYAFIFLPVAVLILFSFTDRRLALPPIERFSLRWYEAVFSDSRMLDALGNSVVVALLSALVATLLGLLGAYALARHDIRFRSFFQWLYMAPITVSYLIIAFGLLVMLRYLELPKSLLIVVIGHVVINLPLAFGIIYSQLGAHQANIERAARDLGGREWQVILYVTIPMIWPTIFAAFFLSATLSWDEFIIALLLSKSDVTLPVELWNMMRSGMNPRANAIGSLVFVISIGVLLIAEAVFFGRTRQSKASARHASGE